MTKRCVQRRSIAQSGIILAGIVVVVVAGLGVAQEVAVVESLFLQITETDGLRQLLIASEILNSDAPEVQDLLENPARFLAGAGLGIDAERGDNVVLIDTQLAVVMPRDPALAGAPEMLSPVTFGFLGSESRGFLLNEVLFDGEDGNGDAPLADRLIAVLFKLADALDYLTEIVRRVNEIDAAVDQAALDFVFMEPEEYILQQAAADGLVNELLIRVLEIFEVTAFDGNAPGAGEDGTPVSALVLPEAGEVGVLFGVASDEYAVLINTLP